jgi:arylsulfatase
LAKEAPERTPNVMGVRYDDTGLTAWSPLGGRIQMPTLQKLAESGPTHGQLHTTPRAQPYPKPHRS